MMRYKRFAPSLMQAGGVGAASDFPPLVLARLRKKEHERQVAALGARENGEIIAPASDVAVPGADGRCAVVPMQPHPAVKS
jgi:hypothetical protein